MTDSNEVKLEALLNIINSSARQAIAEYKKSGHGVPSAESPTFHPLDMATDTLALRKAIRLLEGAYYQLSATLAPPQHTVFNFVDNFNWACIEVALRARIADVLDTYPEGLSVDKLADAVNLDKDNTARILRTLSLMGCFKEVERDVFANTRLSLVLKSTNNAGCTARIVNDCSKYAGVLYESMIDQEFARSREVDKAPRGFATRNDSIKESYWEAIKNDDERRNIFHRGMIGHKEIMGAAAVLHYYPWHEVSSVVDIGSGIGSFSMPLATMFPHLTITNQDLLEIIEEAQHTWKKNATDALLDERVEFVPFDFLEDAPVVGKDVYYLRGIIHDWPDAEATMILRNVRKAMGPSSRVLIHDCVLSHAVQEPGVQSRGLSVAPEPMLPNFGAGSQVPYQLDLAMWLLVNGKERTLTEFRTLGAAAGLVITQVYDHVQTMVMEFRIAQN